MRSGGLTVAVPITFLGSDPTVQTINGMPLVRALSISLTEKILYMRELVQWRRLYAYHIAEAERWLSKMSFTSKGAETYYLSVH